MTWAGLVILLRGILATGHRPPQPFTIRTITMNVHPVVAAFSAKRKKFKVDFNHPLEETLLALPAIFSIKGELRCHRIILSLHGDTEGSTASTVFNTDNGDVNRLVAMAVKSMFGRNNETIFDETVRKGLELRADEHIFSVKLQDRYSGNESLLESELKDLVKRVLFPFSANISFVF